MPNSDSIMAKAEIIALDALGFLASEPDRFSRFLSLSGLAPQDAAAQTGQPEFLASILDYLLSDEDLLLQFTDSHGLQPQIIVKMRQKLPGTLPK